MINAQFGHVVFFSLPSNALLLKVLTLYRFNGKTPQFQARHSQNVVDDVGLITHRPVSPRHNRNNTLSRGKTK